MIKEKLLITGTWYTVKPTWFIFIPRFEDTKIIKYKYIYAKIRMNDTKIQRYKRYTDTKIRRDKDTKRQRYKGTTYGL